MRSLILLLCFCTISGSLMAQKKPKLNNAEKALKTADYATAKDIVDQAIVFEKLQDDPKTWFLYGRVYAAMDTAGANLDDKAMENAMTGFAKAEELGDVSKLYTTDAVGIPVPFDQHKSNYWAHYFNQGASAYGDGDYEKAVGFFEKSQYILPSDTNGYINGALAAHNASMWEEAKENYAEAIDNGVKSLDIFNLYISILSGQDQNYEKALEVTKQARAIFPDDNSLARNEINLLIQMDKGDEARVNLEKQITEEPNNPDLHFIMGVLQDESGNPEAAMASYKKATEIDPAHYNATYNIGVLLISEATEIIKQRNDLGISDEDLAKAEELDPMIDQKLEDALPYWEKIHELQPEDEQGMETLKYLYTQLKMMDKAEAMADKIDASGAGG
ncbi:MAG: hypothetical protein AAGA85_05930 [Bacteroidota bacterium]